MQQVRYSHMRLNHSLYIIMYHLLFLLLCSHAVCEVSTTRIHIIFIILCTDFRFRRSEFNLTLSLASLNSASHTFNVRLIILFFPTLVRYKCHMTLYKLQVCGLT